MDGQTRFDQGDEIVDQGIAEIKDWLPQLCDSRPWIVPFLLAIRESPDVRRACGLAGIHPSTAYRLKNSCKAFAEAWAVFEEEEDDELLAEAGRRGVAYSDRLLWLVVRLRRPEVYDRTRAAPPAVTGRIWISYNGNEPDNQ